MDFLHDKTAAILGYAFDQELLPDFVKEASMPEQKEIEDLGFNAFAKPETMEYPCHNKVATVLSALYASANNEDQDVLNRITKFASAYEVDEVCNNIYKHFEDQFEKYASAEEETPMEKYALTLVDGETETNHYNISTKEDTLLSIKHLHEDFATEVIQPHLMRKLACVIKKAAEQFEIEPEYIPSVINDYATNKLPNVAVAYELVSLRKNASVDIEPYEEIIEKLATAISESDMETSTIINLADEAAEEILVQDKLNNIKYAADQPNPYQILFNGPTEGDIQKFAAEHIHISDIPVPVVDFINLSNDKVNDVFSKQAAEAILTAKEILQGESSLEKTAKAETSIASLSDEVRTLLLKTLASTGW